MNRNLFATLVLLFCIALVASMASCESCSSRSNKRVPPNGTVLSNQVTVKIVLGKIVQCKIYLDSNLNTFKVKKMLDSTVYFWSTSMPYEIGDTVNVPLTSLKQ